MLRGYLFPRRSLTCFRWPDPWVLGVWVVWHTRDHSDPHWTSSQCRGPDGPSRCLPVFRHGASDTGGDPLPGSVFTGSVCCQPSLSSELVSPAPARGQPPPVAPVRGSPADTACWLASPPETWARPLLCSFFAPILMGFLYCSSYSKFQTDILSGCWSVWTPFDTAVVSPRIQVCGNTLSISLGRA